MLVVCTQNMWRHLLLPDKTTCVKPRLSSNLLPLYVSGLYLRTARMYAVYMCYLHYVKSSSNLTLPHPLNLRHSWNLDTDDYHRLLFVSRILVQQGHPCWSPCFKAGSMARRYEQVDGPLQGYGMVWAP